VRPSDHPLYCLTRVEVNDRHRGWQFRTRRGGKEQSRYFSEINVGPDVALDRAKRHRDKILQQVTMASKKDRAEIPRRKQRQPGTIAGVYPTKKKVTLKGRVIYRRFWVACWTNEAGKSKFKKFSVNKYGDQEAKAKAIQAREDAMKALAEHEGRGDEPIATP